MNVLVEKMPPCKIAFMRQVGPYGASNLQLMERFKFWAKENQLLEGTSTILGIIQDDPGTTAPKDCRYDTALIISEEFCPLDREVLTGHLGGGPYLVFTLEHTAEALQNAWRLIFAELAKTEFQLDPTRPIMERYRMEMVEQHLCEICIPVRP